MSTSEDAIFIDLKARREYDLDEQLSISRIKMISLHLNSYYILANKRNGIIGVYLFKIKSEGLPKMSEISFLINKETKFDIDDANIDVVHRDGFYKLIVCYKTIFINKFTVQVIDLNSMNTEQIYISN